ncbi:hypothetical protein GCM10007897_27950 [Sphingobium jiangsuense]|uniref:Porin n=1 Tax=Sphingobium jiangsuense TaxID=870476 RepID=A0A7W6FQM3_9SPHN|nr:DcaP family trimeric outer membrane transporter [Sphingobium jiangsuense]MBB3926159.1 hypothetical protein [Sphingobium jiangsuense]GLT01401.1 hypothetical protein GCM10007897_27950 [Sphingobium jiangsuense]
MAKVSIATQIKGGAPPHRLLLAGAALIALCPLPVHAQTGSQAELEARLRLLEQAVADLKAELATARAEQAQGQTQVQQQVATQAQQAQAVETRVAAVEARPAPPAEGFKVGSTTFKLGGFVKVVASATRYSDGAVDTGALGKEFHLPQQIPVGQNFSSHDMVGHARQTRLVFSSATPVGGKDLKSLIEFDFALAAAPVGAQRSTNPYTPTLRRAFLSYGNWLIGQEWTTFQNPALFPESTDFIGATDGSIFVRQMMVQYRQPLGNGLALMIAAENPQTETLASTSASGAYVDNDHDRLPDFVAKLGYSGGLGELHLAGIVRRLTMENMGYDTSATGWGVSAGGKIPFGPDKRHDLRFTATYGKGMGRYLAVGYVADAAYDATGATPDLRPIGNFAGFAALKLGWTPTIRSSFIASYQDADYPGGIVIPALANKRAWSLAGNLFWSPVKNLDVGIEYRHGEREIVGGAKGQMDRVEMAAKYTF